MSYKEWTISMRVILALILISIVSCLREDKIACNYIENYYQLIYQAELEYELKNYNKAFELYQSAFKACSPINTLTYNEIGKYAEVCAILGYNEQSLDFIEIGLKNGDELTWSLQKKIYSKVFATAEGQRLIADYEHMRTEYLKGVNLDLRKEIQEMNRLDQLYRNGQYNEDKQDMIDEKNKDRLIEIFENFGYPNDKVIGSFSVDRIHTDVGTILLHTEDSIRMNYFVPKLTEFVKSGACSPTTLGTIIDQFYLYNDQSQIYGTYHALTSRYAQMIKDRNQVNKNRISIGLPSLELDEKIDSIKRINYPERYIYK